MYVYVNLGEAEDVDLTVNLPGVVIAGAGTSMVNGGHGIGVLLFERLRYPVQLSCEIDPGLFGPDVK